MGTGLDCVYIMGVIEDKPGCARYQCTWSCSLADYPALSVDNYSWVGQSTSCWPNICFFNKKAFSENALAIKGAPAVFEASSSNSELDKISDNVAQSHKGGCTSIIVLILGIHPGSESNFKGAQPKDPRQGDPLPTFWFGNPRMLLPWVCLGGTQGSGDFSLSHCWGLTQA